MSRIQDLTHRFGAEPVAMRGGGLLVVLSGRDAATDQASQAARCALLLGRLRPDLRLAVATGRAETTGRIPVGAAIDRGAQLLASLEEPGVGVAIDELTAGLLDPTFEVRRHGGQLVLAGEQAGLEAPRLLMGKPTPFVGREKELALLDLTLRECTDESVARALLVTGPPGQGKSRLRYELVARARLRGDVKILVARADPVGAGSAFLLVRQLVRQAMGLREGDLTPEQQASLRAYVAGVCERADAWRIADFLGELIGVPSSERPSPELRAARNDPQIMSVWLRRSFGEWLSAECAARPLLLVLEDLHWGDLPSITYLSEALRALSTKPIMVLALARPEVHEAFPNLWGGAERQEIALGQLTPRAAERLVRVALGDQVSAASVSHIVGRADGNAFYLEELIRHVAEQDSETLPETVLALVQSRLERLEPEARRIVRAASIFGEVLWAGGVAALIRSNGGAGEVDGQLQSLTRNEVLVLSHDSRFAGEREYAFRHSLLREAAYAMLTDSDRAAGHRLAGEWLEQAGEKDALTLADHFELGGEQRRAVPWLVQGAQAALDGGNLQATLSLGDRGVACGAQDELLGALGGMRAAALVEAGDLLRSVAVGREAMSLLPAGSPAWLLCAANLFTTGAFLGDQSITVPVLQAIMSANVQPEPTGPYGWVICTTFLGLRAVGEVEFASAILERAEAMQGSASNEDSVFVACLRVARSYAHLMNGDLASAIVSLSEARALSDRMGHATCQASSRLLLIGAHAETGSSDCAEASADELRSLCTPNGLRFFSDRSAAYLATARLNACRIPEAIALLRPLTDGADRQLVSTARSRLAHALIAAGDLDSATREASATLDDGAFPSTQPTALGALGLVALHRGQAADALAFVARGLDAESRGSWLRDGSILRLVRAEALHALGVTEDARTAIREARDRILRIAATLDDPDLRHSYVTNVAANARTLTLASEWLGEDAP